MKTPRIGTLAPNFNLTAHNGRMFNLFDELKNGPVVLVFYPMNGSPNCDQLLCNINADVDEFRAAGLNIVGINFAEPDEHDIYRKSKFLRMVLLSDENFRVSESYDCLFSIGPIKAIRYSVAGIGTDGLIKYFERGRPTNQHIIAGMALPHTSDTSISQSLLQ